MASASEPVTTGSSATPTSIDAKEAAHFGAMAADWWDPKGSSAMLHRLNPPRLAYIREQINANWHIESSSFTPLAGKRALDVGCGAGLLCEPLARLGATVTGIDAAPETIAAAKAHASTIGLTIDYRAGSVEAVTDRFDLVICLEVIEHVVDPATFVRALANALTEDGLLILSTPNRTPKSRLALITLAEGTGQIPRGTHDWHKFVNPDELTAMLEDAGLTVTDRCGLAFSPVQGFHLSEDVALDYFLTVQRTTN